MSGYHTLLLEDQGPVRVVTLNRPDTYNPIDLDSAPELIRALEEADFDPGVRALVLTGAGKAFSAGGNVRAMKEMLDRSLPPSTLFRELGPILNRSVITLRRLSKPVICGLNGVAAGGGIAWALACDLIVADERARFDPGYIRIGLCPDGGNTALATRLLGYQRAAGLFMRGEVISAPQALAWGMVNQVVAKGASRDEALKIAAELASGPARALASTKALLNQAVYGDLESHAENEIRTLINLADEPDFKEGVSAFFEKRPPRFS